VNASTARPEAFVWGPTIDEAACTDCKVCLEFCQQGVYAMIDDHVRVVAKAPAWRAARTAPACARPEP